MRRYGQRRSVGVLLAIVAVTAAACTGSARSSSRPPATPQHAHPESWETLPAPPRLPNDYGVLKAVWTGSEAIFLGADSLRKQVGGAAFNPRTGGWRALPSISVDISDGRNLSAAQGPLGTAVAVVTVNAKLSGSSILHVFLLDPSGRRWSILPSYVATGGSQGVTGLVWAGDTLAMLTSAGRGEVLDVRSRSWRSVAGPVVNPPFAVLVATQVGVLVVAESGQPRTLSMGTVTSGNPASLWRWNPATGETTALAPAPIPRTGSVDWTGRELILWGVSDPSLDSDPAHPEPRGAVYDTATGRWHPMSQSPLINASRHTSVWTGRELVVWGENYVPDDWRHSGAAYDPVTDRWRTIASVPDPIDQGGTAIWAGSEIVTATTPAGAALSRQLPPVAAAYRPPSPLLSPPLGAPTVPAQPCRAGDLAAEFVGYSFMSQRAVGVVNVTNQGQSSCALEGYPTLTLTDGADRRIAGPLPPGEDDFSLVGPLPSDLSVILPPGLDGAAIFRITLGRGYSADTPCSSPPSAVTFGLPSGGSVPITGPAEPPGHGLVDTVICDGAGIVTQFEPGLTIR